MKHTTTTLLILVAVLVLLVAAATEELHPLSDEFINLINEKQSQWKAKRHFHNETPMSYIKGLMGYKERPNSLITIEGDINFRPSDLPDSFDAREKWPNCESLREIRDQGNCGSCWAIASVEMMTDRYCIASNGTKNFHYSVEDLLSCCTDCGFGCNGGDPREALNYWEHEGIVSGGNYGSGEGCRPYTIKPCDHTNKEAKNSCIKLGPAATPSCETTCQSNYTVTYKDDLHRGSSAYALDDRDYIRYELFTKGPVIAAFDVYEDFLHYSSGVYKYLHGKIMGGHAVKIIGYGEENGIKYWLVANSWNEGWGDKGYFKILRGTNECGIENTISAGDPII